MTELALTREQYQYLSTVRASAMSALYLLKGKQLSMGGICIDQIVDGKIVAEWFDMLGQQLGAAPVAKVDATVTA